MPTDSDFKAAVEGKNAALIEAALVKRVPYVFAEDENIQDWISTEDGTTTLAILNSDTRTIFWLDPDDTTSDHDGVSVCVSSDGKRYHATDFQWPTSILAVGEETPPADSPGPEIGDAYQLGAAPTGDWSSNAGDIAIWTLRGWKFLSPPEGFLFYNRADGLHYFQDEDGDFVTITIVPGPDTVRDTAIIGGARRYIVENQTTNDPPSPLVGVYYIVGSSPTGDWIGQTGKIATSYDDSTWTFITPTEGVEAYDREANSNYVYNGGWVSAAGAWNSVSDAFTAGTGSTSSAGSSSSGYTFSTSSPPTTSHYRRTDNVTVSFAGRRTGSRQLRVTYSAIANITTGSTSAGGSGSIAIGLFRDSETNAIAWTNVATALLPTTTSASIQLPIDVSFVVDVGDTNEHEYSIAVTQIGANANEGANHTRVSSLARRYLSVEEKF